jgi:hypothetical protein
LFKSSVTIEGDASSGVGLVVNRNVTIGNDTNNNAHTINGTVTVVGPSTNGSQLMKIQDSNNNVVAYFKKKQQ